MTAAVAGVVLNSRAGAELIQKETGRPCTRQNLEKLCKAGRLPTSCVSLTPIRVDGERLVAEYLANVDTRQANTINPGPGKAKAVPVVSTPEDAKEAIRRRVAALPDDAIPDLNESRARKEHYQAELAKLEVDLKRQELVAAESVKRQAFALAKTVRENLVNIPDRVANQLAAESDPAAIHMALTREIVQALEVLTDA